jgi:ketosteroid isomerase-like protein
MKTPKQIVESFWKQFRSDTVVRDFIADHCELVMPGMPPLRGHAAIGQMFAAYARALPDFACKILHAIESGDTYAGEARYSGTHRGPLATPQGELPPTGNAVTWDSADIVRVEDGKIVSWHIYHDPLRLLAQLGVVAG